MRTDNPTLIELHRDGRLESIHRGAWVLVDQSGAVIEHAGDPSQAIYPRSATKSLQALPLIESGAADYFGLDDRHFALACASHSGEPRHVDVAVDGLTKIGLEATALRCGPARPQHSESNANAEPIIHNCSGKHIGFLAVTTHLGTSGSNYLDPDSEVQTMVRSAIVDMTGTSLDQLGIGIDGCSAPTFHLPLVGLATGLARLTNPELLAPERGKACRRLTDAARRHPDLIAGTHERFCTDLIAATNGRVFGKVGAEGVYTFGIVGEGIGFAGKVDDGNARGLYALMIDLLRRRDLLSDREAVALGRWGTTVVRNGAGLEVGHIEIYHPEALHPTETQQYEGQ